jgi:hypothetical protein
MEDEDKGEKVTRRVYRTELFLCGSDLANKGVLPRPLKRHKYSKDETDSSTALQW